MNDDTLFKDVIGFLQESCGRTNLAPSTRLQQDLGLTGDEAEEFLLAFGKRYNVNLEDFKFGEYFAPEMLVPPPSSLNPRHILRSLIPWGNRYKPITVQDLYTAAKTGVFRPVPS